MELDIGIRDNQYPMHLSISYSRVERILNSVPLCLLLACQVVSGDREKVGGGQLLPIIDR